MSEDVTPLQLRSFKVPRTATIREAMAALDANAAGIVFVEDSEAIVGTITDGDLRRAILNGHELDSPAAAHMRNDFAFVSLGEGRTEALDLMRALQVEQIPILDEHRRLCGIHLMREIAGSAARPNWGVIMAGGQGTRLRPLTESIPKPMIRVAGRPIVERLVLQMIGHGIRRIFLAINYLGEIIEQHFGDGSRFGCRIEYLRESDPLGTGGALSLFPTPPTAPVVVVNGDLVTQADLGAMIDFHNGGGQAATVAVRPYVHTIPFGCVTAEQDRIVAVEEKPRIVRLVNAGIYVLSPHVIARMDKGLERALPDVIAECVIKQETVRAFELIDDWIDVGRFDQLQIAREGPPA